jgi:hypothetical protein
MNLKERIEFQQEMVNWLVENGISFHTAMIIVSFCEKKQTTICEGYERYIALCSENTCNE